MLIWACTVIALIGTVLNAKRKRSGFLFWIISNGAFSIWNYKIEQNAQALLFFVYLILAIYGYFNWGKTK